MALSVAVTTKIEGKLILGPPVLLVESSDPREGRIEAVRPEKLKAFEEALGRLFGMEDTTLLSREDLESGGERPRPNCCCCICRDYGGGGYCLDDRVEE